MLFGLFSLLTAFALARWR
ncbi:hypothetical protein [Pseudescherichia sp.]